MRTVWKPTPDQLREIETLSGIGMTVEWIADFLKVSKATFDRAMKNPQFREALSNGRAKARAKIQQTAYSMASSGKHPAMTIFWLKTQCRWKEPPNEQVFPDKNGDPQSVAGPKIILTLPDNGRSAK